MWCNNIVQSATNKHFLTTIRNKCIKHYDKIFYFKSGYQYFLMRFFLARLSFFFQCVRLFFIVKVREISEDVQMQLDEPMSDNFLIELLWWWCNNNHQKWCVRKNLEIRYTRIFSNIQDIIIRLDACVLVVFSSENTNSILFLCILSLRRMSKVLPF